MLSPTTVSIVGELERLHEQLLPRHDLEIAAAAGATAQLEALEHRARAAIAAADLRGNLDDLEHRAGEAALGGDDFEAALERVRHDLAQVTDAHAHAHDRPALRVAGADRHDRATQRELVHAPASVRRRGGQRAD